MLLVVHVVVAPDSFKGSLPADLVAEAVAEGLRRVRPDVEAVLRPIADGGEGTVAAALRAGYRARAVEVSGPDGRRLGATIAFDGTTAVVELATAAGLGLLEGPAPLTATTYGVGELLRAALDGGAERIVLGIGGSATNDGGAGMLQALGVRLLDGAGAELPPGGAALARLDRVDVSGLDPRVAAIELVVASDVDNPLTGPSGAAAVFGPQKGASRDDVAELDAALSRYATVLGRDVGVDPSAMRHAGGAGGTAAGAIAVLGATVVSGAGLVCDLVGLAGALDGAVLAVTGEGAIDEQTLRGKAPAEVSKRARAAGVPCLGLAGVVGLPAGRLAEAGFVAAHGLVEVEPDVARCLADPAPLLAELAARVLPAHLPPPR